MLSLRKQLETLSQNLLNLSNFEIIFVFGNFVHMNNLKLVLFLD